MSYSRKASKSYEPIRRKNRPSSRLKAVAAKQTSWAIRGASEQNVYANIMDIVRFLSRFLSGKQNVVVYQQAHMNAGFSCGIEKDPHSHKSYYAIRLPNWETYKIRTTGFSKYRVYRSGVWHETMHARNTPARLYSAGRTDPILHDMVNVIEDRRIEDLGVRQWPGYLPERLHSNAYAYALRPDVGDLWKKVDRWKQLKKGQTTQVDRANCEKQLKIARQQVRHEAFLQRVIIGKAKGLNQLPKSERELIEDTARYVEQELAPITVEKARGITPKITRLAEKAIKDLDIQGFDPPSRNYMVIVGAGGATKVGSSWDATFTPKYAKEQGKTKEQVKKGMKDYFDGLKKGAKRGGKGSEGKDDKEPDPAGKPGKGNSDRGKPDSKGGKGKSGASPQITQVDIERAIRGSAQARKEYQEAHAPDPDKLTPGFGRVAASKSPGEYRDKKFRQEMDVALKDWRIGRKEIVGRTGSRFSIRDYRRDPERPFITRIRKSARGRKVLVIADFSSSMSGQQEQYKKALINGFETLDSIGTKTAFYGFAGEIGDGSQFFFKVKRFEDPRWTKNHSARTAALVTSGGTPTDDAYRMLEPYIRKHRPDVTVTMTDGAPADHVKTETLVRKLKKQTRMVAFGLGGPYMEQTLKGFGYHKVVAVPLRELPRKLVDLIAPTG